MEIFVGIICVVFGILQIILFFKIWGMTGNVEKLAKKICYPETLQLDSPLYIVAKYQTLGQPEKAIEYLCQRLDEKQNRLLINLSRGWDHIERAEAEWRKLINNYSILLNRLGGNIPENYKNFSFLTFQFNYQELKKV